MKIMILNNNNNEIIQIEEGENLEITENRIEINDEKFNLIKENLINNVKLKYENNEIIIDENSVIQSKLKKLRKIRNEILNETDWLTVFIYEETIKNNTNKYPDNKINEFLNWRQYLRDLPQILDLNNINFEDIYKENINIFPPCPI